MAPAVIPAAAMPSLSTSRLVASICYLLASSKSRVYASILCVCVGMCNWSTP